MSGTAKVPRLFVGSSTESLDVAYAIQENLEFDAETTVWTQGFFAPSSAILSELLRALHRFDFAAFVFTADDKLRIRDEEYATVRDNVIFELGLFFGGLGQDRCFFVVPRNEQQLHLPSDLLGVAPLTYSGRRSDGNLVAALGSACNALRRAFRSQAQPKALQEYLRLWQGPELHRSREGIREVVLDHYSEEFTSQISDVQRVFAFLEGLSEAVLAGAIDEGEARRVFGPAVLSFWPVAASMLAPPNHRDDWWQPVPKIAELHHRWSHP